MASVKELMEKALASAKLDILVFGPAVEPRSNDAHIASLQQKRLDIRQRLLDEGHSARFGEEVVDASLPAHLSDPLLQEVAVMRVVDLIIVLVGSPGSIAEAISISREGSLCRKATFYCFEEHKDGIVGKHLKFLESQGATFSLMSLPDVEACHLTGAVLEKVRAVHVGKAFLFP